MQSSPQQRALLLAEIQHVNAARINAADAPRLKTLKRLVPHGVRDPLRERLTAAARPLARRRVASRLASGPAPRLNLGSGYAPIDGWTNIDLLGAPVDVPWNLKRGIPFPDDSVEAVFSEHVFEHIPLNGALALIQDAVRALVPGGVFRVAVPDAGLLLRSYAGIDDEEWALSRSTRMQAVMSLFYENGHCTMYDDELLITLCELAGLQAVEVRQFRQSRLGDAVPDSDHRRSGTLYVEGLKPGD